ncbi:MAG: hypothetical protein U0031_11145 [Thermomicrobiales bacterium]
MRKQRRHLIQILFVTILAIANVHFAPTAEARTFLVCPTGCDFTTIAAALQAAKDGDTIAIGEGTYAGGVVVEKKVTLAGVDRDKTIIQGTSSASVIRIGGKIAVTIEGVTITGGGGSRTGASTNGGGGILNEGELTLIDSIVRGNTVVGGEGGGIYSESTKPVAIRDSVISGNQAMDGGGIFLRDGDVEIADTTIANNQSTQRGGGLVYAGGKTLRLERCTVRDNRADFSAGGLSVSSHLELANSVVSGNRAPNTGGLVSGRELARIVGTTFSGNVANGNAGGIRVGSGGVALVDSTVEKNRATSGAGIFTNARSSFSGNVSLTNTTVRDNTATQNGGGIANDASEIVLDTSRIVDNHAGNSGGGIYSQTTKKNTVRLRNGSVIAGNEPDQCAPAGLRCRAEG